MNLSSWKGIDRRYDFQTSRMLLDDATMIVKIGELMGILGFACLVCFIVFPRVG